jgi:hypothetical protein
VNFETVVTDVEEHRRRVECRVADIPGHAVPTRGEVQRGEWYAWDEGRDGRRLLIDATDTASAMALVLDTLRRVDD